MLNISTGRFPSKPGRNSLKNRGEAGWTGGSKIGRKTSEKSPFPARGF